MAASIYRSSDFALLDFGIKAKRNRAQLDEVGILPYWILESRQSAVFCIFFIASILPYWILESRQSYSRASNSENKSPTRHLNTLARWINSKSVTHRRRLSIFPIPERGTSQPTRWQAAAKSSCDQSIATRRRRTCGPIRFLCEKGHGFNY